MYGYFTTAGFRLRFYSQEVLGLSLLRAQLPEWGSREKWERKALDFFCRAGVRWTLNGPERCAPLRQRETGALYRHKAAELALLELEGREIPLREAVVGLRASRWTREMEEASCLLASQVRALALELPHREEVVWQLQQQYGIPVLQGDGDVTLCFTPAEAGDGRLLLGEPRPIVEGAVFRLPGLELPEGCPEEAVICVLCECGRTGWGEVKVLLEKDGKHVGER